MSMWKRLLVAVAVVAMAIPAFSAVESVKVGGDIDIYGIKRVNIYVNDSYDWLQTHARVYVQAALTDNVEAMVRLINERVWLGPWGYPYDYPLDILLDLAYIKVSDLLTPGLALTVGRQEIQFGEGLVVGSAYLPYNYYPFGGTWIQAQDLGKQKAFDAIRVDYSFNQVPVDLTAFLAKVDENFDINDENLYGLNLGFNAGEALRIEGYYVRLQDMSDVEQNVTTAGVRVTGNVAGFALKGEYAKQFGEWGADIDNKGWALLLGAQYNFPQSEMAAYVKGQFNYYSGTDDTDKNGWLSYFPSNVASRIGPVTSVVLGYDESNLQVINVGGGISPVEKVSVSLDWFNVNFVDEDVPGVSEKAIGNEISAALAYKYTEDLTFGLQYGILLLSDGGEDYLGWDDDPWQLIASMKVVF
ncbi:MAG: alginate export family protein [Candidatus Omnitrophica bacterium]|nr:alginate export family protein [Candidatus Omnitrophota bacterium]